MSPAALYSCYLGGTGVTTVTQRDMVVRLYRGAEQFINEGAEAMLEGRCDTALGAIQKAKRVFIELLSSLDYNRGGKVAYRLRGLYSFFIGQLVDADRRQQPSLLRELLPLIAELRVDWEQIPRDLAETER